MSTGTSIFERGQIWHWDDPIYGPKERMENIHNGESTQRYSRYVLIIETNQYIIDDERSILVIPLTSQEKGVSTVPITIRHFLHKTELTYAYVKRIMCIDTHQLSNYQCKISDADMDKINKKLIELIINPNYDVTAVTDTSGAVSAGASTSTASTVSTGSVATTAGSEVASVSVEVDTSSSSKKDKTIWTDVTKMKFIDEYKTDPELVISKYNLAQSSAERYYYKFRKEINSQNASSDVAENKPMEVDTNTSKIKKLPYHPSKELIQRSISKLANHIRDDLRVADIYHKITNKGIDMDITIPDFYRELSNIIYFAFSKYMNLSFSGNKIIGFSLPKIYEHEDFYIFFMRYYNDYQIKTMKNLENIIKLIKEKYNGCIPLDVIDVIDHYVKSSNSPFRDIPEDGRKILYAYIETHYLG